MPRCESSTAAAPAKSGAYGAGTTLPPCSQLTRMRRRRIRDAVGERFAKALVDARDPVPRRREADGSRDPRGECAVAQVVLEQPPRRDVDRRARRHGLDEVLPEPFEIRAAAAQAEGGEVASAAQGRGLRVARRELE